MMAVSQGQKETVSRLTAAHLPQWLTLDKDSDTKTLVATAKAGKIPKWLSGSLYLNGPGIFHIGDQQLDHLLDGFAVIHRFLLHDGEVKYQSCILDSDSWTKSCKANQLVISQFATYAGPDPCKSTFDKLLSYLVPLDVNDITDNTFFNIVEHGDKLYALTESTIINEVDPDTLLRKSKVDLSDTLAVHLTTAHPHFDADGTMYNLGTSINPMVAYSIVAVPPKQPHEEEGSAQLKKATLLTTVPSRFNVHVSYNHSFGMSEKHFIILEQPVALNLLKVVTANWRRGAFGSSLVNLPEEKTSFRIVRRSDKQLLPVTFETESTYCFHFINCFEVEEHLVVDLCGYDSYSSLFDDLYLRNIISQGNNFRLPVGTFRRYILPTNVTGADPDVNLINLPGTKATAQMTKSGVIHCKPDFMTDDKIPLELPHINYKMCGGKNYRYAYGISALEDKQQILIKVDLERRKILSWGEKGYSPGEPNFIAKSGAKSEDEGVILSPVLSEIPDTPSYLLVLDAKTFKEIGRAFTPCDVKMALTFHGFFRPDKK